MEVDRKIFYANIIKKKPVVTMLICDIINLKTEAVVEERKDSI